VHDRPDRSDCCAGDVKRNQQAFFGCWKDWHQIGITPFEMCEQEGTILVEHISTRAEVPRGTASDMGIPHAGDGGPIKPFAANVRFLAISRQQAKAGGVTLGDVQNGFSQPLKNAAW
jgi:hypothetical protein